MAHHSIHRQWLAFYQETTACVPPADWAASGTPIEFISVDLAPKEALLVDPTAETRIQSVGKRRRIKGIRNVDWSAVLKLHGSGAAWTVENENTQVAETALSKVLTWCCGAVNRSFTRTVVTGTATTLEVGAGLTTGFIPGCLVAVEDTTSPTAQNLGKLHFARVIEVDAGNDEITLAEDLPFIPAAGDIIHGTLTVYVDEDYLEDAIRAGAIRTWNWFHKRAKTGTEELWQLEGCVGSFTITNLGRGQLPQVALSIMAANFRYGGEDSLTSPSFGTPQGKPQLSMGRDVKCSISDYSGTTRTTVDVNATTFEPGLNRVRVETATEEIERFEGMSTYSVAPTDCKMTFTVLPHADSWYGALHADTDYRVTLYQPGPGGSEAAGVGKAWCIMMPKAQIAATPSRVDVNEVSGAQIEFSGMEPDDCTGGSNENIEKSVFLIGLA